MGPKVHLCWGFELCYWERGRKTERLGSVPIDDARRVEITSMGNFCLFFCSFGGVILTSGEVELLGRPWWIQSRRMSGGQRFGGWHRRHGERQWGAVPMSNHIRNQWVPGNHTTQPLTLKLMLFNARSVKNKTNLMRDLITNKHAGLACIRET